MTTPEPKSECELGWGPSEKQEPEGVLEPETASELELVPGVMLESVTVSEWERAPGGSLSPERGSEMETSHQECVLKLGLRLVPVQKLGLAEAMEPGLVPYSELMMEPTQELELAPVKTLRLKEFLEQMMKPELELESVMEPGLEEEPEKKLEEPGSLSVELPWEPERWLEPEVQKVLEPEGKPELELDLVLPEKNWPEQKLAPGQVNMLGPWLSSTLEHVERLEPTTEGEQVPETGTGMGLWPDQESSLPLTGKPQLVPKREVQAPQTQQVPVSETHWSTELGLKLKQVGVLRWGWGAERRLG